MLSLGAREFLAGRKPGHDPCVIWGMGHFEWPIRIYLLFSRKQQRIFTTSCLQYHIRNQCTQLAQYSR